MIKAREIMTRDVVVVTEDTPIIEALELLIRHRISGIPVVDSEMRITGMLSERDMLRLHNEGGAVHDQLVADYMTQPAVFFDQNESAWDIGKCFSEYYIRRVPITDDGRVVGIVSAKDVLEAILDAVHANGPTR